MNREIKFRMWNNVGLNLKKSKYFYDADIVMDCLKQQIIFDQKPDNKLGYNHVCDGNSFEQFTGLQDENGKDIYEGDLVNFTRSYGNWQMPDTHGFMTDVCEIIFDKDECFRFALKYKSNIQKLRKHWNYKYEVIGNVNETPELKTGF